MGNNRRRRRIGEIDGFQADPGRQRLAARVPQVIDDEQSEAIRGEALHRMHADEPRASGDQDPSRRGAHR